MRKRNQLPIYALWIALTVALSILVHIPIPGSNGFVTITEVGIYSAALLFGPVGGCAVGMLSGGLLDLLLGYPQWLIFSVVIHGIQGYLTGKIGYQAKAGRQLIAMLVGTVWMIIGYFAAGWLLYGFGAGIASIVGNIFQNGIGIVLSYPLIYGLKKAIPQLSSHRE